MSGLPAPSTRITDGSLQLVAPDSSGQRWFWIGVSVDGPVSLRMVVRQVRLEGAIDSGKFNGEMLRLVRVEP